MGNKTLNTISVNDLTSKYQEKIDNYNTMVNTMTDEQKNLFQIAINIYDIKKRQEQWDSYVGYALKALLISGYYYDAINQQWKVCMTKENFVDPYPLNQERTLEDKYNQYIRELYPRESCMLIGVSRWEIEDADVNPEIVKSAVSGEMVYEYFDLELGFDLVGEQAKAKVVDPNYIAHPEIPISPKANVAEMTKGDTSTDKFIYAYTDSGISKNKRDWRPMIMDRIAQQVMDNMPPGNLGHVSPDRVGYDLPLPVVTWIGAVTELLPDGVNKRLWLKGYVIPVEGGNQLKTFVRAKAINSISVYGGITLMPNNDGTDVSSVLDIDLKSIDISGKLKEGLNSGITELAGEMHNPTNQQSKEMEEEANSMSDLSKITLAELKVANPTLLGEMRNEIIASMETENSQKLILTKAGEMDAIVGELGTDALETAKQYKSFAGEMAEAVGIMPQGATLPTLKEIIDAVKENVAKVTKVTELLKPNDGQDVVAKAQEVAEANKIATNTQAIDSVKNKFDELTSTINNDAIKNLVSMQFNPILNAKPEEISDTFATESIAKLEAEVPTVVQTVVAQAQNLIQTGQTAGEMSIYDNIGTGAGVGGANQAKDIESMSEAEYLKSLGYNFD